MRKIVALKVVRRRRALAQRELLCPSASSAEGSAVCALSSANSTCGSPRPDLLAPWKETGPFPQPSLSSPCPASLGTENGFMAPCCVQEPAAQRRKPLRAWRRGEPLLSTHVTHAAFTGMSMTTRLVTAVHSVEDLLVAPQRAHRMRQLDDMVPASDSRAFVVERYRIPPIAKRATKRLPSGNSRCAAL